MYFYAETITVAENLKKEINTTGIYTTLGSYIQAFFSWSFEKQLCSGTLYPVAYSS